MAADLEASSYGVCETAANVAEKVVTTTSGKTVLRVGATVTVKFVNNNTVASPTLNVDGTGAINIMRYGTTKASTSSATSWYNG
jgi:3-oxoacyl-[acyl-carrier-protein] synthase III